MAEEKKFCTGSYYNLFTLRWPTNLFISLTDTSQHKVLRKKVTFVAQTVPKFKFNSAFFSAEAKKYCIGVVKHAKEYLFSEDAKIKTTER